MAFAERGDRQRDDRRGRRGKRSHPQPAALQAGERAELVLGIVEAREDRLCAIDQQHARVGEDSPLGHAPDQGRPHLRLQRRDLPGDRGLGVAQRLRGSRERPVAGDLAEHSQPPAVKHDL